MNQQPPGHTNLETALTGFGIMGSQPGICSFMSQILEKVVQIVNGRSLALATIYTRVNFFFLF